MIFCGHFPDGVETFTPDVVQQESKGEWYLRQMLGSANFRAGPALAFLSGNLCYQIEHHLFPDLPSNRYAEIARQVRALCDEYGLPYTTGPLLSQFLQTQRTILEVGAAGSRAERQPDLARQSRRDGRGLLARHIEDSIRGRGITRSAVVLQVDQGSALGEDDLGDLHRLLLRPGLRP